jgi:hypothetical protein
MLPFVTDYGEIAAYNDNKETTLIMASYNSDYTFGTYKTYDLNGNFFDDYSNIEIAKAYSEKYNLTIEVYDGVAEEKIKDMPSDWATQLIDYSKNDIYKIDDRLRNNYQKNINRKDFAYLCVKIYEYLTNTTALVGDASFVDTTDLYCLKAKNIGIIEGYEDETYKPNDFISRAEIAVLLNNIINKIDIDIDILDNQEQITNFTDLENDYSWANDSIIMMHSLNIINGRGNNKYYPMNFATKEEAISMGMRFILKFDQMK